MAFLNPPESQVSPIELICPLFPGSQHSGVESSVDLVVKRVEVVPDGQVVEETIWIEGDYVSVENAKRFRRDISFRWSPDETGGHLSQTVHFTDPGSHPGH